jgi:hypothetical protein
MAIPTPLPTESPTASLTGSPTKSPTGNPTEGLTEQPADSQNDQAGAVEYIAVDPFNESLDFYANDPDLDPIVLLGDLEEDGDKHKVRQKIIQSSFEREP